MQLATLKAELSEKSGIYSNTHPELIRLKRQIAALEEVTAKAKQGDNGLDALQNQRSSIQKNLEVASQRLAAAHLGESLERDQFSERLEVLEQAVMPTKPIKPNRRKMLAMVFALAMMAGAGSVVAAEVLNASVRTTRDLFSVADPHLVSSIPYIATRAELARQRAVLRLGIVGSLPLLLLGLAVVHLLVKPLDELWSALLARLLG